MMIAPIKLLPIALMLMFVMTVAGACPQHPTDPGATLYTSYMVTVTLTAPAPLGEGAGCTLECLVCVWQTSSGDFDYFIDASSIAFVGDCGVADGMTTIEIFDILSHAAIAEGVANHGVPCDPLCPGDVSDVYAAECVERLNSGAATIFEPCNATVYCNRQFTVCCPNGSNEPLITEIPLTGTTCSGTGSHALPCEATCN